MPSAAQRASTPSSIEGKLGDGVTPNAAPFDADSVGVGSWDFG